MLKSWPRESATRVEEDGEVKMTKQEIIAGDHRAGFEAVERDTVYNKIERAVA